jgi:hypothetical protein
MPDQNKFADRAVELAAQAAAAAEPLREKAAELAGQAAAATGPLRERAVELAGQAAAAAGPLADQARVRAAQGVDVIAENLDKLTGGKYSDQIHSVAVKLESALDKPAT